MQLKTDLRRYFAGLTAVFLGAWLTGETGSLIPLALGGSVALMATSPLVRTIWTRNAKRR